MAIEPLLVQPRLGTLGREVNVLRQLPFSEAKSGATDDLAHKTLQEVKVPKKVNEWTHTQEGLTKVYEDAKHDDGVGVEMDEINAIKAEHEEEAGRGETKITTKEIKEDYSPGGYLD